MTPEPPALPPEAEDALRDSIAEFGVLVPVTVEQNGVIIEGRHRARIAESLSVSYRSKTVTAPDQRSWDAIHRRLNDRQLLSVAQRRQVVAYLDDLGHSGRAIARGLRMGKHTVGRDLVWQREHGDEHMEGALAPPQRAPLSVASGRFVAGLAEVLSTTNSLSSLGDLNTVLTAEEARQWHPRVARAVKNLRTLQNRLKEHAE